MAFTPFSIVLTQPGLPGLVMTGWFLTAGFILSYEIHMNHGGISVLNVPIQIHAFLRGFRCDISSLSDRSPPGKPLISYCKMMFALRNHNEEVVPCVPNKKIKCLRNYKPPFRPIFLFYEPGNAVVRNNSKNDIRVHNTAIIFSNSFITNH